jgi:transposase
MVAANARTTITFALSPGNDHDAPQGRLLLEELGAMPEGLPMPMDKAYEVDKTRQLVLDPGMIPVVPPESKRLDPWEYDRELYKKRNEVKRLFRRLRKPLRKPQLRALLGYNDKWRVRAMRQQTLASQASFEKSGRKGKRELFLNRMEQVVP